MVTAEAATLGHEVDGKQIRRNWSPWWLWYCPTTLCFLERKHSLLVTLSLVLPTIWVYS